MNEYGLVRGCARVFLGTEPRESLSERLRGEIDWDVVVREASAHAVTPMVYSVLSGHGGVPEDIRRRLHEEYRGIVVQNLSRAAELRRLLEIFQSRNIPVVPFKGPALAWLAYEDLGAREFCDLDLLVRPEDVEAAAALLAENGYRTDLPREPERRDAYLHTRHEIHFIHEGGGSLIELHQSFLPRYACFEPDYGRLWRRLEPISLCGTDTLALRLEDLLPALCAHGAKHCWARLGWICDIGALVSRHGERVNWAELE
ncbi:MAG TPA: nucleotidyltransferase family protein, partial [Bryobacteraceae bacterium]|nr:nucleotidyltransferase family protein [Bryobacteraceae bacterium]